MFWKYHIKYTYKLHCISNKIYESNCIFHDLKKNKKFIRKNQNFSERSIWDKNVPRPRDMNKFLWAKNGRELYSGVRVCVCRRIRNCVKLPNAAAMGRAHLPPSAANTTAPRRGRRRDASANCSAYIGEMWNFIFNFFYYFRFWFTSYLD